VAIGKPVDAEWQVKGCADHDLAAAGRVHGENLPSAPVGEPEPIVVPAWRLAHGEPRHQRDDVRFTGHVHPISQPLYSRMRKRVIDTGSSCACRARAASQRNNWPHEPSVKWSRVALEVGATSMR